MYNTCIKILLGPCTCVKLLLFCFEVKGQFINLREKQQERQAVDPGSCLWKQDGEEEEKKPCRLQ